MVCYVVPLGVAILVVGLSKFLPRKHSISWLELLLFGGSICLIMDHLWNGELFLIGENVASDLALGLVMTTVLVLFWYVMVLVAKLVAPRWIEEGY
ncbi:MAG TPA: hypothetical protein HA346_01650 [Thermoplasmata archaeon]|nr:hypothetical protein [Thermoplasmata archaeon]